MSIIEANYCITENNISLKRIPEAKAEIDKQFNTYVERFISTAETDYIIGAATITARILLVTFGIMEEFLEKMIFFLSNK